MLKNGKQANQSNTEKPQIRSAITLLKPWIGKAPLPLWWAVMLPSQPTLTPAFPAPCSDKGSRAVGRAWDVPPGEPLRTLPAWGCRQTDRQTDRHLGAPHSGWGTAQELHSPLGRPCTRMKRKALWWLLTHTGLPGRRIASIVMETASALTVVPPREVNTAWMAVTRNDPLCTLINICLREKHKPAGKLISFDTNTVGLFF